MQNQKAYRVPQNHRISTAKEGLKLFGGGAEQHIEDIEFIQDNNNINTRVNDLLGVENTTIQVVPSPTVKTLQQFREEKANQKPFWSNKRKRDFEYGLLVVGSTSVTVLKGIVTLSSKGVYWSCVGVLMLVGGVLTAIASLFQGVQSVRGDNDYNVNQCPSRKRKPSVNVNTDVKVRGGAVVNVSTNVQVN